MSIKKINIQDKFQSINSYWDPKIISQLNGQMVKIAKVKGDFVMHHHEHEDELFFVIEGLLYMELEDQTLEIHPGEMVTIPKGIKHRPYSTVETKIMLFEPASTLNTGNHKNEMTKEQLEEI